MARKKRFRKWVKKNATGFGDWVYDNRQAIGTAAAVIGGAALIATGVGAAAGAGLISATVGASVTGAVLSAGVTAGVSAGFAVAGAQDAQETADEQNAAAQDHIAAEQAASEGLYANDLTKLGLDANGDAIDEDDNGVPDTGAAADIAHQKAAADRDAVLATRELANARKSAEDAYNANTEALEYSRQRALGDVIRQEAGEKRAASSYGGRGGTYNEAIGSAANRATGDVKEQARQKADELDRRYSDTSFAFTTMGTRISNAEADADFAYKQANDALALAKSDLDIQLARAQEGLSYQSTVSDLNTQAVYDSTRYSWLTGALQGASFGLDVYSFGTNNNWWGG